MKALVIDPTSLENGRVYEVIGEQESVEGTKLKLLQFHDLKTEAFSVEQIAVLQDDTHCYHSSTFFEEIVVPNDFKYFLWDGELNESFIEENTMTGTKFKLFKPIRKIEMKKKNNMEKPYSERDIEDLLNSLQLKAIQSTYANGFAWDRLTDEIEMIRKEIIKRTKK